MPPDLIFNTPFMRELCAAFRRRSKAIKHSVSSVEWLTQQPDDYEWLTLFVTPAGGNYCIFQFTETHQSFVYVKSIRRHDRGKILLAIEDLTLSNNGTDIVAAVEFTIAHSRVHESTTQSNEFLKIRNAWNALNLRVANELSDCQSNDCQSNT